MPKEEIQNLIRELVEKITIRVSGISVAEEKPGNFWVSLEVAEPHFFIGRDGEGLHALNHLVNIRAIAHMMSERARYFKSSIEVDPMTAFERRIVHEFLAEASDLQTESVGAGRSRRVVIKYIGAI